MDGKYVHDLYREGFELQELQNDASWNKIVTTINMADQGDMNSVDMFFRPMMQSDVS